MRTIGLTGGIATGKSTVAALLTERGAIVVDADSAAREVVEPGQPALAEIAAHFGDFVVREGRLNRAALGELIFADPSARRELEAITHPRIRQRLAQLTQRAMALEPPLVVVDIPLLFETGRAETFDGVMVVYASPQTQAARLRDREGLGETAIAQRLAAQIPIDDKRGRATWVIDNDGPLEATVAQIDKWWAALVHE